MSMSGHGCQGGTINPLATKDWLDAIENLSKSYLLQPPCLPGVSPDPVKTHPRFSSLAMAYAALVEDEVKEHQGRGDNASIATAAGFGHTFAGFWLAVNQLNVPSFGIDRPQQHGRQLDEVLINYVQLLAPHSEIGDQLFKNDHIHEPRVRAATLLSKMLIRSFDEVVISCQQNDRMVIRHHLAVFSDSIQNCHELVNRLSPGDPTEASLPAWHPHRLVSQGKELP